VKKSLSDLSLIAEPEKIDVDWTSKFMKHAGDASNEEMQSLWAKILAGEANKSGSFSKRTLNIVSQISKNEAELFSTMCRYSTIFGPIIYDHEDEIYTRNNISFDTIRALKDAGLIDAIDIGEFTREKLPPVILVPYFNRALFMTACSTQLAIGQVKFSTSGEELSRVCKVEPVDGFFDYLLQRWYPLGAAEPFITADTQVITTQRMINPQGKNVFSPFPKDIFGELEATYFPSQDH